KQVRSNYPSEDGFHLGPHCRSNLLQCGSDLLGMLPVTLEDFKAGLQQAPEFGICGGRDERDLKRAIHYELIPDLIGKVSLVEFRAIELRQFGAFASRLLG